MQIAPVPVGKSASDAPACVPRAEDARPAPGCWFWIPDVNYQAVDGGAAASSSGGAIDTQEERATPLPGSAAGASRPSTVCKSD